MRHLIGKLATGAIVAATALAVAGCGGDGAANNAATGNAGATQLNVGDPAAVETIGNAGGGNAATGTPPPTSNPTGDGAPPPPADTPVEGPGDVGGDTGGNSGAAINGM